ncbi:MAG: hypothetical protein WA919_10955 [Coleofasciculaceae cyanobacterium]
MLTDKEQPYSSSDQQHPQLDQGNLNHSQSLKLISNKLVNWFNSLTVASKAVVVIFAAGLGMSLLSSTLQLVSSLINLASLGVIIYLVYRFFVRSKSSN